MFPLFLLFALLFFFDNPRLGFLAGKTRSRSAEKEYGDSGAGIIVSQIMDSEKRTGSDPDFSVVEG